VKLTDNEAVLRVLHVDDDVCFLEVSKQILEMEGKFEVDNAMSVGEAFQKLEKQSYDAVVSDYEMPSKDGLQFLKELREQDNTIPFCIFTGKGREEAAIKALDLGADGYFNKTGDPETVYGELVRGIRKSVEAKKAKAKACIEEERLKAILTSSPDAIVITDLGAIVVNCNDAALNLAGYLSKEEFIGKSWLEIIQKKGYQKAIELSDRLLEKPSLIERPQIKRAEFPFVKSSGAKCFLELSVGALKDAAGNPLGYVSVLRDISERKRVEEQNRKLTDELNRVFDALTDLMLIIDMDNRIVRVNKKTCEFLKKKPEELLGKHCYEVMHRTDKPWKGCPHVKVLKSKHVASAVIYDPSIGRQLLVTVSPIFDERGEFVQCVHSAKDIADFKRTRELSS
jgi:PAS domain S-box-containing protein